MSLVVEQAEFMKHVSIIIAYAFRNGIALTGGELFRTNEQQQIHLRNGKSKTKYSRHQDRLAIDFNFFINGELTYKHPLITQMGEYWESLSVYNRWGGNFKTFKDTPHFERRRTRR